MRFADLSQVAGDDWSAMALLKEVGLVAPSGVCPECGGEWAFYQSLEGAPYFWCRTITRRGFTKKHEDGSKEKFPSKVCHHKQPWHIGSFFENWPKLTPKQVQGLKEHLQKAWRVNLPQNSKDN